MSSRSVTLSTLVFVLSVMAVAVSITVLASQRPLRLKIDATKSRAYSLSEQTLDLLSELEGDWTLSIILTRDQADPATVRQVDEVMDRFSQASPSLQVMRVDPTRPGSIRHYETLLRKIQDRYRDEIRSWDRAIDVGLVAFKGLIDFAAQATVAMRKVAATSSEAMQRELNPRVTALSLLAGQGHLVTQEIERSLQIDEARPLPDYAVASAILIQALSQWAQELDITRRLLAMDSGTESTRLAESCGSEAAALAIAADGLKRLPPMELARIGRHLQTGEAAIVLGPAGATVVPAGQLFASAVAGSGDRVSFDRRFRGEQLLAAAIRSLVEGVDPSVVFVHGQERSMLQASPQHTDVSGAAAMLEAGRVAVQEWSVTREGRPLIESDGPVVWIVLPPAQRTGLKPSDGEMKLLRATADLIRDGESVMLSIYPSLLPRYGQADPWAALAAELGVDVQSGSVIAESTIGPDGDPQLRMAQVITEFTEPTPMAAALHGQTLALPLAIPIGLGETVPPNTQVELMGHVQPSATRWLEQNWSPRDDVPAVRTDEPDMDEPLPVVAAISRASPAGGADQRILIVGSGGWNLNYVADMVMAAGGDRYALLYPGNHELLLSGTSWLAHLDNRIAPGPLSQEVARLGNIPTAARTRWTWILLLGYPGLIGGMGLGVWMVRRS